MVQTGAGQTGAVTKITVKIAGYEIALTPDEVRELRGVLNEIYPMPQVPAPTREYRWKHDQIWPDVIKKYTIPHYTYANKNFQVHDEL